MEDDVLEKIGLTHKEKQVYVSLLRLGSSTTGPIIKTSKLHSSVVYHCLEKLIQKGLVGYVTKCKKKYFESCDPNKFLDVLDDYNTRLKELIPELVGIRNTENNKRNAYIYEGYTGVKEVMNDMLRTLSPGEEDLSFGPSNAALPLKDFFKRWNIKREKLKIKKRIIFFENAKEFIEKDIKLKHTQVRVLPKEFESPLSVDTYGDKTAMLFWSTPPIVILIENKKITESFSKYFELMWKISKPISLS